MELIIISTLLIISLGSSVASILTLNSVGVRVTWENNYKYVLKIANTIKMQIVAGI